MTPRAIVSYEHRLDSLFGKVRAANTDLELQAQLSCHLCVLVSGYLEVSVRTILQEYARSKSHPFVSNFVSVQIARFQNPSADRVFDILQTFNREWADGLRAKSEGKITDHVNSIVSNRHNIAHGALSGISFVTIASYYESAQRFVQLLQEQCTD